MSPASGDRPKAPQPGGSDFPHFGIGLSAISGLMAGCDMVTFDVFDTLLARAVVEPEDVFALAERLSGRHGFARDRVRAEAVARKQARPVGTIETSLDDIYRQLGLPPDAAEAELFAERQLLFANPPGLAVLDLARALGKRVVAITDMYLPGEIVDALLRGKGIVVDRVYSSCDHRDRDLGKYNGTIFAHVAAQEAVLPGRILHVGDHLQSDVAKARAAGWAALHIDKNIDVARRLMPDAARLLPAGTAGFSHSAVAGMILKLAAGQPALLAPTSGFRFGCFYGGPLVVGFLRHVLDDAPTKGIGQLNLLARDGAVVRDALDLLEVISPAYRLLPASRRMTVLPRFATGSYDDIAWLFGGYPALLSRVDFLDILGLSHLLAECGGGAVMGAPKDHVAAIEDALRRQAQAEKAAIERLYRPHVGPGVRAAWVDVGWALSSVAALNTLLGVDLPGYFVGSHDKAYRSDGFASYLFTYGEPLETAQSVMRAAELIELIFADTAPGTRYAVERDGALQFDHIAKSASETVRDAYIAEVRQGVLAYVRAIAPLFDHLDSEELRTYNRRVWSDLCARPLRAEYDHLSKVPHDAVSSGAAWRTIGDLWRPQFVVEPGGARGGPDGLKGRIKRSLKGLNRRRNTAMRRWRKAILGR